MGASVFCPVSGVAFAIKPNSAQRDLAGKALYFCCESCADYFAKHRLEVLTRRGLVAVPAR